MQKVYTAGYTSHKPEELKQVAETLGAVVVDIRFRPWSWNAGWCKSRLEAVLGDRYAHIRGLGNRNYRGDLGDEVILANYEEGRDVLRGIGQPVILLCACAKFEGCHRQTAVERLIKDGFEYGGEVSWPSAVPQPTLCI